MYNGELVEINKTDDIFDKPSHDYTRELLRAIPQPNPIGREERKKERLSVKWIQYESIINVLITIWGKNEI